MPNWKSIVDEIEARGGGHDMVRRKYLKKLAAKTNRNVIAYYSGWLQRANRQIQGIPYEINDGDKNAFMATIHKMDRAKGLDLILHTPGGDAAATESIIDYLRSMFGTDIRAIVPQIAMSAGTMIALACKSIVMGKHSNIGPVDPQIMGMAAHAILDEFQRAVLQIQSQPHSAGLWNVIMGKLPPTIITSAQNAIAMAEDTVRSNLISGMFDGDPDAVKKAAAVIDGLTKLDQTKTHSRHISITQAAALNVKVEPLEADPDFQDLVLSVHHAFIHTMSSTTVFKITENQNGVGFVQQT